MNHLQGPKRSHGVLPRWDDEMYYAIQEGDKALEGQGATIQSLLLNILKSWVSTTWKR